MRQKIYVVWVGETPGIYTSWAECEKQVKGYTGACYKSFATMAEAERAYQESPSDFFHKSPSDSKKKGCSRKNCCSASKPQFPYLAVDAACSGNPGKMEFRAMIADTGSVAFHRGPYEDGTNNVGEFLAIVLGLVWLQKQHLDWPIYSDSKIALGWVEKKHAATKLKPTSKNTVIFENLRIAESWLQNNAYETHLLHWDTKHWGEIPADFGRK